MKLVFLVVLGLVVLAGCTSPANSLVHKGIVTDAAWEKNVCYYTIDLDNNFTIRENSWYTGEEENCRVKGEHVCVEEYKGSFFLMEDCTWQEK